MDWQVGDLALCLKVGRWSYQDEGPTPTNGEVCHVVGLFMDDGVLGLFLEGYESDFDGVPQYFRADRFRKIKPDTEPCEEEFTLLIKRMKPAKVGA